MTVIVDDHLLMSCLALSEPGPIQRERRRGRLYTSGLWYHRLCRAMSAATTVGRLSARMTGVSEADVSRLLASCRHLPEIVQVVSFRSLAWPMAEIARDHRLNLLQLEVLASARELGATICVWEGDQSPTLAAAARAMDVPILATSL